MYRKNTRKYEKEIEISRHYFIIYTYVYYMYYYIWIFFVYTFTYMKKKCDFAADTENNCVGNKKYCIKF